MYCLSIRKDFKQLLRSSAINKYRTAITYVMHYIVQGLLHLGSAFIIPLVIIFYMLGLGNTGN